MYQVNSYLCFLCVVLIAAPTGVDATCDGIDECFRNGYYFIYGTEKDVNWASELDSYCLAFESLRACAVPELQTCDLKGLEENWLSYVKKEQYICSTEGRLPYLASINCLETSQNVAAVEACSTTYATAVDLVSQRQSSGYYDCAEAAHRDICRAIDDLYVCSCNAVRPACGQVAATFHHEYLVKATEDRWNSLQCPAHYGCPSSCNGGNREG